MSSKASVTKAQNEAHKRILTALMKLEDNRKCADCLGRGPTWASVNLGVFICLNCSGIHRSLGVHNSKVRSTNLDTWLPEQVAFIQRMGNRRANHFWEARLPEGFRRPAEGDMSALSVFIGDKYRNVWDAFQGSEIAAPVTVKPCADDPFASRSAFDDPFASKSSSKPASPSKASANGSTGSFIASFPEAAQPATAAEAKPAAAAPPKKSPEDILKMFDRPASGGGFGGVPMPPQQQHQPPAFGGSVQNGFQSAGGVGFASFPAAQPGSEVAAKLAYNNNAGFLPSSTF
ncbi:hypothetical protein WJX72_003441 [[Myrmecia] bisecta]|uniref:Arf-GAP domain-containing protein n=1 Tax=[Myrmecia] bisecta TaxID=41462 RepID=A0AAW1PVX6_9CHLO